MGWDEGRREEEGGGVELEGRRTEIRDPNIICRRRCEGHPLYLVGQRRRNGTSHDDGTGRLGEAHGKDVWRLCAAHQVVHERLAIATTPRESDNAIGDLRIEEACLESLAAKGRHHLGFAGVRSESDDIFDHVARDAATLRVRY